MTSLRRAKHAKTRSLARGSIRRLRQTGGMKTYESNLAEVGTTTVPKVLRVALGVPTGGRLAWTLQPDGTLLVRLKCTYPARSRRTASVPP